ncbi:hypothetical protein SPRA44_140022 [Serratia proteamaculans]|nr:hypothetical protein SPRA44_140022 [Serratia proteamaculans]
MSPDHGALSECPVLLPADAFAASHLPIVDSIDLYGSDVTAYLQLCQATEPLAWQDRR